MDPRVQEILDRASDLQKRYVLERPAHKNPSATAKAMGLNRSTPHHWDNFDELEEAAQILLIDVIDVAKKRLERLVPVALDALERAAKGRGAQSVTAARAILDRVGLPAQANVDVTSGGEPLQVRFTWYDPANTDSDVKTAQSDPTADDHP